MLSHAAPHRLRYMRAAMRQKTTTPNPATLAAFRRLMRARAALSADDAYALDASRAKLRDEFKRHRGATDAGEIEELLAGAAEVEDLLINNVVQGRQSQDSGAFKFKVKGSSSEDEFAHRAEPVDDLELALAEAELSSKEGKS